MTRGRQSDLVAGRESGCFSNYFVILNKLKAVMKLKMILIEGVVCLLLGCYILRLALNVICQIYVCL